MVQVMYLYTIFGTSGATFIPNTRIMDKKDGLVVNCSKTQQKNGRVSSRP